MPWSGLPVLQRTGETGVGSPGTWRKSVTGAPYRRLKDGNAVEKPTLSAHKLEAVGSKYHSHSFKLVFVMFVRIHVLHRND